MPAPSTLLAPAQLIEVAKAPILGYNEKHWTAVRAAVTPDSVYDEVATARWAQGVDEIIALWQGWGAAMPDSRAAFDNALPSGNTVVFELSWTGTHRGPLQTPAGSIPATGKTIDIRACWVVEVAGDKVKAQRHYFDLATLLRQLGVTG
jgi:steroid delta-isomerase-like uncharacterized protein